MPFATLAWDARPAARRRSSSSCTVGPSRAASPTSRGRTTWRVSCRSPGPSGGCPARSPSPACASATAAGTATSRHPSWTPGGRWSRCGRHTPACRSPSSATRWADGSRLHLGDEPDVRLVVGARAVDREGRRPARARLPDRRHPRRPRRHLRAVALSRRSSSSCRRRGGPPRSIRIARGDHAMLRARPALDPPRPGSSPRRSPTSSAARASRVRARRGRRRPSRSLQPAGVSIESRPLERGPTARSAHAGTLSCMIRFEGVTKRYGDAASGTDAGSAGRSPSTTSRSRPRPARSPSSSGPPAAARRRRCAWSTG